MIQRNCDHCGKSIPDYHSGKNAVWIGHYNYEDGSYSFTLRYDLCQDCCAEFAKWANEHTKQLKEI